jgi:tetratricopeptide (TPR) repeat protein
VEYIEEAIGIRRELGLRADLSASLNNGANLYSGLAALQQTREEQLGSIQKAVEYIEEAIGIRRELGLILNLAYSLATSVFIYIEYLKFNEGVFTQLLQNCDEAIDIFETFNLPFKYCPLLQIGIILHQVSYESTRSVDHTKRIDKYETLLQNCK